MTSVKRIEPVSDHVCGSETTMLEVMARLNAVSPYKFQIVVDGDGRIIGSVTDGDMRRAILRGIATDAPVTECTQSHPIVGRVGDADGNAEKLARLRGSRRGGGGKRVSLLCLVAARAALAMRSSSVETTAHSISGTGCRS